MPTERPRATPVTLLDALPEAGRHLILSTARRRDFKPGERLAREGDEADSLLIIESGRVAIRTSTPDGDPLTLNILGAGGVLGEVGLFGRRTRRTATVQALDPVIVLVLSRTDFARLREQNAEVDDFLLEVLARQVDRLSHLLAEAFHLPADRRVARRVWEIGRLYVGEGAPLTLPITQDEVAQIAGTTRPTTNQALKRLEVDGAIQLGRGLITINDLAILRAACAWS